MNQLKPVYSNLTILAKFYKTKFLWPFPPTRLLIARSNLTHSISIHLK